MSDAAFVKTLSEDFEALRTVALERLGVSALTPTTLHAAPKTLETPNDVEEAVRKALSGVRTGWVRRESWAGGLEDGDPGFAKGGAMLEGEWALAPNRSLSLLYDGRAWRLTTLTEGAAGTPMLREDTRLIDGRGGAWTYAVYWGAPEEDPAAIRRLAVRLTGHEEAKR